MMKPEIIKFQFEIRYSNILNFGTLARDVLSPFLRLASGFSVSNQGLLEEEVKLEFDAGLLTMDFRWDRIIVISERNMEHYSSENSDIDIFFSVLDKIASYSSFGSIKNYIILATAVYIVEENRSKLLNRFKEKFLNNNCFGLYEPNDYAVVFEKTEGEKLTSVTVGPFLEIKDLNSRSIRNPDFLNRVKEKNSVGYMMDIKIFENTNGFKQKNFFTLADQVVKYSELLTKI